MAIDAAAVLEMQAAVLSRERFEEAAAAFATHLAQAFALDRASIGFVADGYARVVAVSHGAAVDAALDLPREVAAAMDEAIDQAATVCYPALSNGPPRITLCHAALARRQSAAVCSIPIVDLASIIGAVTIETACERSLTPAEIEMCEHVVSLLGPVLSLKRQNDQPGWARARDAWKKQWARLAGPGERAFKLALALPLVAAAVVLFVPLPYHVTAPARLEGAIQRALVAASDGYIQQIAVRPGDTVKQGQVIAELARQDLLLERSKWESELAQQLNAYGTALARADRPLLMVNHAKAAEARAQLELIEKRIERAQIKAPFDGIVISGDLTQSLGAPVRRGDTLMVIAPQGRYRLIVEVDERDIADVNPGAAGRIVLAALPGQPFSFEVQRLTPVSATREGRHYFEVEGRIDARAAALRPGLQGIARIEADARPLASRLFGRLATWIRLQTWAWGWWS
ncbi:MAG: efflux RND transporter periplasmic adaptor subunit [Betaproteobacteria bacterium]